MLKRLFVCFVLLAGVAGLARGDGVHLALKKSKVKTTSVSQSSQKALILFDDGVEILYLKSNYRGPAADMAWIVPVPSKPSVERSEWTAFHSAEHATRPQLIVHKYVRTGFGCGCGAAQEQQKDETIESAVTVIETMRIRELSVEILQAKEGGGFLRWLQNNEYDVPDNAKPVLEEYVQKGFYFVAVKIAQGSFWATMKAVNENVHTDLTPIAITFKADKPFFPLKISSIGSAPENELLLMVVAKHRMESAEFPVAPLTVTALQTAFGDSLYHLVPGQKLDLSPAVRVAQKTFAATPLVLESALRASYNFTAKEAELLPAGTQGKEVFVTRFHAFLKPSDMKDIHFVPTPTQLEHSNKYYIPGKEVSRNRAPVGVLAVAGLALMCGFMFRSPRLRRSALVVILVCGCLV